MVANTGDVSRWTAGIDWVTWVWDGPGHALKSGVIAHELVERHTGPLDRQTEFRLLRWKGWKIGAVRLGLSEASSLLQLSGAVAAESWTRLQSSGGRPTRLDVQTTLQLSQSQPGFGRQFLKPSTQKTRRHPSQRPKTGCWKDSNGSFLGTVGDRTNARYMRVYDKGVEAKTAPPGLLWRIEVEAKGKLAPALFRSLTGAEEVERWCLNSCAEQWSLSGYSWPLPTLSSGSSGVTVPTDQQPDEERLAQWLRATVRPAVQRLRRVYSREQLLQLLGLSDERGSLPEAAALGSRSKAHYTC